MGYYIRVLGKNDLRISIDRLTECLPTTSRLELNEESSDEHGWSQLVLRHKDGPEIAVIERNPVVSGELGAEEIEEFIAEAREGKPASAAKWLVDYLPSVRVIYAFQLLKGTEVNDGWGAVHAIQSCIWKHAGGILQADNEGFSNENGHHIVWQFNDEVDGEWGMAVLNHEGEWTAFRMNLGDPEHRAAFLQGRVPSGVLPIN